MTNLDKVITLEEIERLFLIFKKAEEAQQKAWSDYCDATWNHEEQPND